MTTPSPADLEAVVLEGLYADWKSHLKRAAASALALLREQAEQVADPVTRYERDDDFSHHYWKERAEEAEAERDEAVAALECPSCERMMLAEARVRELKAALREAIRHVEHMEMPDSGVIGPNGEREKDYHEAVLYDTLAEWRSLASEGEA